MKRMLLEPDDMAHRLEGLNGWTLREGKLHRELHFDSFAAAFAFMTQVAHEAEALNHHPDWFNSYTTVVIDLMSHDLGGITERDFRLAAAIDRAAVEAGLDR